ncbi:MULTISPECIES: autotransporter domain-containing protein [unclassified Pseudoxanthomonas]|uniref:autotransporter domain-containing protein n=1 Tax=unclassified Pseudoxanthomonas TaxID=2645906 RepID=UPI0015872631|nr:MULTISPECIES: autotransporter domain-containing protein [unclassified Pseudoxanthomonas]
MAVALAMAAVPALAQDGPYTQTVFFGDSLTDAGYFRPLLPASVRAVTGQFTTNPGFVWSQYLAEYYGTSAYANGNGQVGTNYAAGGARVGTNTTGALGPIPSLATQVNTYLSSTGGRADPNALYTVWGGANDLFAITSGGANPTTTIGAAVTAQVGIIGTLQTAGARYILVPTIPDLGVTPGFRAQGTAAAAAGTQLSTTYNTALFDAIDTAGFRVIPLDTFTLLREIVASPAEYGFANVTGTACQPQITANSLTCNPTSYVTPNAPDTYAFADGVHPTSKAHSILSQYAVAMLEGPRQIALLPYTASVHGRARADRVASHVNGKPEADGMRWWGDLRGDFLRYDHGDLYDGAGPMGTFGVDWSRGSLVYGAFAGYGRAQYDFGKRSGSFDESDATLGGFAGWYGDSFWANAQVSYSWISYDVDREVQLGDVTRRHSGSPDGTNLSLGLSAGYQWGEGAFRHGPVISVVSQTIEMDGYSESNVNSSALAYPDQDFDSLIGSAGYEVSYAINDHLQPYARLTVDKEFEDPAEEVFAQSLSLPGTNPYAVPGLDTDNGYGTLLMGARTKLFGFDANLGVTTTVNQGGGTNTTAFMTLGGNF